MSFDLISSDDHDQIVQKSKTKKRNKIVNKDNSAFSLNILIWISSNS